MDAMTVVRRAPVPGNGHTGAELRVIRERMHRGEVELAQAVADTAERMAALDRSEAASDARRKRPRPVR